MKSTNALLTGIVLLGVSTVSASSRWDYSEKTLDNGMRVIVMEDHSAPIAAVQVWYHVGSKDENPERTGFAHMFEHMMFRGTERIGPEDHFKYLRRFGGNVNGYTTWDTTVYIEEVPSNQIDLTFWLEAERMANLKINEEYFAEERDVVKEEYRLRVSDPPYGTVADKALAMVFKVHPYKWTPIGNLDHLNAATADELREFFDTYYVPNNATLVVVGDVTTSEIFEKAQRYFGWIPKSADPPRVTVKEPPVTEPRRLVVPEKKGPLPIVGIGYRVIPANHADRHAFSVLDRVLSGGESSRVYRKLVKEDETAIMALSATFLLEQDGLWVAAGVVKPGANVDEVESALLAEIENVINNGITEQELQKARNNIAASTVLEKMTVSGKAQKLGYAAVVQGNLEEVNKEYDDLMAVSREDVQRVAREYFKPESRMTLIVEPQSLASKAMKFLGNFGLGGKKSDEKESDKKDEKDQSEKDGKQ